MSFKEKIYLRTALREDIPEIISLYQNTVRSINAGDYTPEQIEVWASGADNLQRWEKAIEEQYFILAELENRLAGFSSIAKDGYLDFMYVSKDHQRIGVASALLDEIERKAKEQHSEKIYSHLSKSAKGFFLKKGYEHIRNTEDLYRGVMFINALMEKNYKNRISFNLENIF